MKIPNVRVLNEHLEHGVGQCFFSSPQSSCVHPKDREKIVEIDDQVRSSIAPVEVEYRIIRPGGETRFVRSIVQGIRDDQGVPVGRIFPARSIIHNSSAFWLT